MTENTAAVAMQKRMPGRVAIVTGAAGSLGQAIARRFAAEGATLVLDDLGQIIQVLDRNQELRLSHVVTAQMI